jgi:hypothetical protein
MRKTLGICLAASCALWLGGCGDDDSACVESCEEGDASSTGTDSEDTVSDTDRSSTSTGRTTSAATTASGTGDEADSGAALPDSGNTSVEADSGVDADGSVNGDGGVDTDADVPEGDGGLSPDAGDAEVTESDAAPPDAGDEPSLTACEQACVTAAEVGCADNSDCETSICGLSIGSPAECEDEVDAYLECVAAADPEDEEDFECSDDQPSYIGAGCYPLLQAWSACFQ